MSDRMGLCQKPSKWEWISVKLKELGFDRLSEITTHIEKALKEIYGQTNTEDWVADFEHINEEYNKIYKRNKYKKIVYIGDLLLSSRKYCIACIKEKSCSVCKFGQKCGFCSANGSLFDNFIELLLSTEKELKQEVIE